MMTAMSCFALASLFAVMALWSLNQAAIVLAVALPIAGALAGAGIWLTVPALIYAGAGVLLAPTPVHVVRFNRAVARLRVGKD